MRPLEGIKVVELGTHVAVPMATRLLADLGAEVVKIESITGDLWRWYGLNTGTPVTDDENPIFSIPNSNKKIISLNMKSAGGMKVFFQLLEDADVFISNVRLDGLKRLGLDYDSLKEKFPKLVYFHFTGYGYEGPWASKPGFDIAAFWAAGGIIGQWPMEGDRPFAPSAAFGDATVSSMVASAVLAGVVGQKTSGKGCYLTTSLYATALWYNFGDVIGAQPQYKLRRPFVMHKNANAFLCPYQCADGDWVYLAALEYDRYYEKCLKVLGLEQYIGDPRYCTAEAYYERNIEFSEIVAAAFMTRASHEWVERFGAEDIVIARMARSEELCRSEQAWAEDILTNVTFPESGNVTAMPNPPVKVMGEEHGHTHGVGGIGCGTREVLEGLGYTDGQIEEMARQGIVRMPGK